MDAFISYRRKPSAALALLIQEKLVNKYAIDAYVDTTRADSTKVQFPERLMQAIGKAPVFICLLGEETLESEWVLKEIEEAYRLKKRCIPVFQESYKAPAKASSAVSYLLNFDGVHIMDLKNIHVDYSVQELALLINPQKKDYFLPIGLAVGFLLLLGVLAVIFLPNMLGTQDAELTEAAFVQSPEVTNSPEPSTNTDTPSPTEAPSATANPTNTSTEAPSDTPSPEPSPTEAPSDTATRQASLTTLPTGRSVRGFAFCDDTKYELSIRQIPVLRPGDTLILWWGWIAASQQQVLDHLEASNLDLQVNGEAIIDANEMHTEIQPFGNQFVVYWEVPIGPLNAGDYVVTYQVTWDRPVYDGSIYYGPGTEHESEISSCSFSVE